MFVSCIVSRCMYLGVRTSFSKARSVFVFKTGYENEDSIFLRNVQIILYFRMISKNLQTEMHITIIRCFVFYRPGTWTLSLYLFMCSLFNSA